MIKFRYIYSNGKGIKVFFYTLVEVENFVVYDDLMQKVPDGFKLISRDRFTGLKDINKTDIFERDITKFNNKSLLIEFRDTHACFSAVEKVNGALDLHYNLRKDMAENRLEVVSNTHIEMLRVERE